MMPTGWAISNSSFENRSFQLASFLSAFTSFNFYFNALWSACSVKRVPSKYLPHQKHCPNTTEKVSWQIIVSFCIQHGVRPTNYDFLCHFVCFTLGHILQVYQKFWGPTLSLLFSEVMLRPMIISSSTSVFPMGSFLLPSAF